MTTTGSPQPFAHRTVVRPRVLELVFLVAACSDPWGDALRNAARDPLGTSGEALPDSAVSGTVQLALTAGARYGACVDRPTGVETLEKLLDPWDQYVQDHRLLFECVVNARSCGEVIERCHGVDPGLQCTAGEEARCDLGVAVNCVDFGAYGRLRVALDCDASMAGPYCQVREQAARCSSDPISCFRSRCDGESLSYCYEGASMTIDCKAAGRECGRESGTAGCVLPGGCSPSCSGTELTYCPTSGIFLGHVFDCASMGSAWGCKAVPEVAAGCRATQPTCSHGATRCVGSRLGTCVYGAWVEVDCASFLDGTCLAGPDGARCEESDSAPVVPVCKDECAEPGFTCANESTLVECAQKDGCLQSIHSNCGEGRCFEGACIPQCVPDCNVIGWTTCLGAEVLTCGLDSTDCQVWGAPEPCPGETTCLDGECVACTDECAVAGSRYCAEKTIMECTNDDVDPCTDERTVETCGAGRRCEAGECVDDCVDECDAAGATECSSGFIRTCGQHDGDTCLEWGAYEACAPNQLCLGTACECVDVCPTAGAAGCDGTEVATCTPDDAGCLIVAATASCGATDACTEGVCGAPPIVVLNELGRQAFGSVIELRGPPGLSLHGWSLTLLDDTSAVAEKVVPLMGTIDEDGFWVTSSQLPPAAYANLAAQNVGLSASQRVVLRQGTRVVDAVAFGNVGSVNDGSGEGTPAPLLSMGKVLARNAVGRDTGDNARDLRLRSGSSFGAPNVAPNSAPTAILVCSSPSLLGSGATVDGSSSYDFDDEIVSWTIAFGDGSVASTSSANHIYGAPGTYEVTLTVEDASGASTTSICVITIEASSPPVVTWTTPEADLAAAPGTWLTFAVAVEVAPGRSVVGVEFSVGGVKQGEMDTVPPYSMELQVPTTGPGLEVTATAVDALGERGMSSPRIVTSAQ